MRYSDSFGEKASKMFLGTAYFGDGITQEDAFSIMDKFREMGGTHIDTARLYANGKSEEIVGKWLKERKASEMHVFTKGGYYEPDAGEISRVTPKDIVSDLENSLKALGTDSIEFYWLHRDDRVIEPSEVAQLMNSFVKEGKIRKFGASNWRSDRIKAVNDYAKKHSLMGFSASQIRFNPAFCLGERGGLVGMNKEEFEFYKESEMPVVAYSSQAKGFFSKVAEKGIDALSEKAKKRYLCEENLEKLEVMKSLSEKYNCSVGAIVCGAMCSINCPDTFPVIGGSRVSQIEDSVSGADIVLSPEELKMIFKEIM
ncbi:MAG: aldo/keto reductase [Ruminococcaceae bacterium]|nr:aldo/keto reductase [Oscillospiraceae bacterium]